jgi:hypothetical protein
MDLLVKEETLIAAIEANHRSVLFGNNLITEPRRHGSA